MARGVRIRLNQAQLTQVVGSQARAAAHRAAHVARSRARNTLSAAGRYDTGDLDRTMTVKEVTKNELHPQFAVGSPVFYAKFQEFGTRAHGPVVAKKLRFKPKGSDSFVFAEWVRGVTALRFMYKALKSLTVYDFLE